MTIYGIEQTYRFGEFKFDVGYDSGSETGLEQREVDVSTRNAQGKWADTRHLRSFYYEDVHDAHIRAFCKKFAEDAEYRAQSLAGTTDWALRNALFYRNVGLNATPALLALGSTRKVWAFVKQHWQDILNLPEYQRLQALDSQFDPLTSRELDPEISQAVERFNQVPLVKTRFSCQGVSGLVTFQDIPFLVVTPHEQLAYISFEQMPYSIALGLEEHLTDYPAASYETGWKRLVSTGDNLAFRQAALALAFRLVADFADVDPGMLVISAPAEAQPTFRPHIAGLLPERLAWLCEIEQIENTLRLVWLLNHWAKDSERLLYRDRQGLYEVKAAILRQAFEQGGLQPTAYIDASPSAFQGWQLDFASEQSADILADIVNRIEDEERDRLLCALPEPQRSSCPYCRRPVPGPGAPRLHHMQAAHPTKRAFKAGAAGWILGQTGDELRHTIAPDSRHKDADHWSFETLEQAARQLLPDTMPALPQRLADCKLDEQTQAVLRLCEELLGRPLVTLDDAKRLEPMDLVGLIQARLERLLATARETRQPLRVADFEALYIPSDILAESRGDWWEMDKDDLRQLDPEANSLIAFAYTSALSHYEFHLPLRVAEMFLSLSMLDDLRRQNSLGTGPGSSAVRELGEYYGRPISDEEADAYPIIKVHHELGVAVALVCPKGLVDKREYVQSRQNYESWRGWEDEDDEDDPFDEADDFDEERLPRHARVRWGRVDVPHETTFGPHRRSRQQYSKAGRVQCPRCKLAVEEIGSARIAHWKEKHTRGPDLTAVEVAWVLFGKPRKGKEIEAVLPAARRSEEGTRYWTAASLDGYLEQRQHG